MKILKRVGLMSEYLKIGFGPTGIALTQLDKSSRVVPLQELAIDRQHTVRDFVNCNLMDALSF